MIRPTTLGRRSLCVSPSVNMRRVVSRLGLTALFGVIAGTLALTPSSGAPPPVHIHYTVVDSTRVPGHMYLNNADGTVTDVTQTYVQTGTAYDAQKGYTIQTGHVMDASGSSIDVTVDIREGQIEDWGGKCIGFIAPQMEQSAF